MVPFSNQTEDFYYFSYIIIIIFRGGQPGLIFLLYAVRVLCSLYMWVDTTGLYIGRWTN